MALWFPVDNQAGVQPIENTDTVQNNVLGKIIKARSDTLGEGEFIYLLGVASTVVGSVVRWNATTYQTTLITNTTKQGVPVAVAMSANVASQYGWYQLTGLATAKKTAVTTSPNAGVYISGTAGRIMPTSASGVQILGARTANLTTVTSTTSTVVIEISRPHAQGQIT